MNNKTNYLLQEDTIAAIATPPGDGAISIVRLSGKKAFAIAESIFSKGIKKAPSHTVHFGHILDEKKKTLDSVLLLIMKGPNSYTGEDIIEINCHGGNIVTKKILQRILEKGARPAEAGEFTYRAFQNKKIDLAQAEAVQELIAAQNETAMISAKNHLEGKLSEKILNFQKRLTDIAAIIEAWVDFPEEGLEFASEEEVINSLEDTKKQMEELSSTYENGRKIKEGIKLCLCGTPNVGKSSLLNLFLGKDRAIVTEIPGTTRDILEEDLKIGPFNFHITDTAGIRKTNETIEKEGIKRSKKAIENADIILLLLDASKGLMLDDYDLMNSCPKEKTLVIWNKIDLALPSINLEDKAYQISVKENKGIDDLLSTIHQKIWHGKMPSKKDIYLTHARHKKALDQAIEACKKTIEGLKENRSAEFVSLDIRHCLMSLASIIGTDVTEDILSSIFSQFCVGK